MALDLSVFQGLQPPKPPDILGPYQTLQALKTGQLQQADIASQIQERQALAAENQIKAQQQKATFEQGQKATQIIMDHLGNGGDPDDPAYINKLYLASPAIGEAYAKHRSELKNAEATRKNLESEAQRRKDETAKDLATIAETHAKNLFDQEKEKRAEEAKQAEEAAGILIPGTEFTTPTQERAAWFRVRNPDGTYTNKQQILGKQGQLPRQPEPPMDPERLKQEETLKVLGKEAPEVPALDDIVETMSTGRKYIPISNLTQKQKEVINTQASKQNIPVVDKDVAEMLRDLDTARANQQFMLNAIESKLPKDAAGRVIVGPANKLKQIGQLDPELAATGTFRNAAIQSMRALAGSRGLRINQAEILMAVDNDIPKPTDTVETARKKLADIMTLLDNTEKSHLERNRGGNAPATGGFIKPGGALEKLIQVRK